MFSVVVLFAFFRWFACGFLLCCVVRSRIDVLLLLCCCYRCLFCFVVEVSEVFSAVYSGVRILFLCGFCHCATDLSSTLYACLCVAAYVHRICRRRFLPFIKL